MLDLLGVGVADPRDSLDEVTVLPKEVLTGVGALESADSLL